MKNKFSIVSYQLKIIHSNITKIFESSYSFQFLFYMYGIYINLLYNLYSFVIMRYRHNFLYNKLEAHAWEPKSFACMATSSIIDRKTNYNLLKTITFCPFLRFNMDFSMD